MHFCVVFCSLCSLNQRCVAPFLLTMLKKIYENSLFGCGMCAYLNKPQYLTGHGSSSLMLAHRSDYCRSLPPVVEFYPASIKCGTCTIDHFVVVGIPTCIWSRCLRKIMTKCCPDVDVGTLICSCRKINRSPEFKFCTRLITPPLKYDGKQR